MIDADLHPDDALLNEYLDGELSAPVRATLDAHLAGCLACAQRLSVLQTLFTRLENLPDEAPARDLSGLVQRALSAPKPSIGRWTLRALGAAQLVLVAAALFWLIPTAAWQNLASGWSMVSPIPGPDFQALARSLEPALSGWQTVLPQLWQSAWKVLAEEGSLLSRQAGVLFGLPGLSPVSMIELGAIGLAGTLAWLLGNGLLIGTLNRKSQRRNS